MLFEPDQVASNHGAPPAISSKTHGTRFLGDVSSPHDASLPQTAGQNQAGHPQKRTPRTQRAGTRMVHPCVPVCQTTDSRPFQPPASTDRHRAVCDDRLSVPSRASPTKTPHPPDDQRAVAPHLQPGYLSTSPMIVASPVMDGALVVPAAPKHASTLLPVTAPSRVVGHVQLCGGAEDIESGRSSIPKQSTAASLVRGTGASVLAGIDWAGGKLANFFGVSQPKYGWALEEYEQWQRQAKAQATLDRLASNSRYFEEGCAV